MSGTERYIQIEGQLGELHKHLRQLQSHMLNEYHISLMEYHILAVVQKTNNLSQNEIAEALNVDKALVSRQIRAMEKKGLLSCRTDTQCRRKKVLSLSQQALELIPKLNGIHRRSLERVFSDIDEKLLENFQFVLEGLVSRI